MNFLKTFLFFIFFVFSNLYSQELTNSNIEEGEALPEIKKTYYVFSPKVSVTVPHPISNKAFRNAFVGVYEVTGGLNVMVFKGAFIGVSYKNGLTKTSIKKIPEFVGYMKLNNLGLKIGGDFIVGDKNRIIATASITAGNNWTSYSGFRCKVASSSQKKLLKSFSTSYIEPEFNLFFLVEKNFAIGFTISYNIINKSFDPYELCLNEWSQFDKVTATKTQYLSFGFGFHYSFLSKKKQ